MSGDNKSSSSLQKNYQQEYERLWFEKFSALCYKVMYQNPDGAELLAHLENKYFRRPVAYPDKDPSWAFHNDGFNECIRFFSVGIQVHLNAQQEKERARPDNKPLTKA